jgi:hypothetical protein
MEVGDQLHITAFLLPGKEFKYPLDRRLGGFQNQSGHCGEKKNFLPLPGIKPQFLGCPARSPLLYHRNKKK